MLAQMTPDVVPAPVASRRLVLTVLPPAALSAIVANRLDEASGIAGCDVAGFPADERGIAALRLNDLDRDPLYLPWSLRAICLEPARRFVGYFNFHSRPDPDYLRDLVRDAVELGYFILPEFRRQGLAEEATLAMMDWAARTQGISRFVVSISPDNAPSVAMHAKLGFKRIGGHVDEVDGYEDILLLTRDSAGSMG